MLSAVIIVFLFVGLGALAAIVGDTKPSRSALLPPELGRSRLFSKERLMERRHGGVLLRGKADEVREMNGELFIIETKHRTGSAVYPADRAQIRSYAYLLRDQRNGRGRTVAKRAFIRLTKGKGPARFVEVDVGTDAEVLDDLQRLKDLKMGAPGRKNGSAALCRHCGHRNSCKKGVRA
jgi:CRISPR/Cas system-associated exonuclease Cas4 (RecB family)